VEKKGTSKEGEKPNQTLPWQETMKGNYGPKKKKAGKRGVRETSKWRKTGVKILPESLGKSPPIRERGHRWKQQLKPKKVQP